jgi:hypothetical protein
VKITIFISISKSKKTEETFYIFLILFNRSSFGNPVKKTAGINSEKEQRQIVIVYTGIALG